MNKSEVIKRMADEIMAELTDKEKHDILYEQLIEDMTELVKDIECSNAAVIILNKIMMGIEEEGDLIAH